MSSHENTTVYRQIYHDYFLNSHITQLPYCNTTKALYWLNRKILRIYTNNKKYSLLLFHCNCLSCRHNHRKNVNGSDGKLYDDDINRNNDGKITSRKRDTE